ncbi:hypothetical protein BHYA_0001g00710 [Botrytis hyacinthi]|uniref:Cytochrome P450 monooxygenase n=1 Tax=Botrytis hyacinthi TaxID=278943 RepID=A0A4Z1H5U7_9HELO|nr:hypothetical protein BHYA_0001g00710 [Botrytis hyacinthi]
MALIEFTGHGEASTTKPVLALVAIFAILLGSWLRAVLFPHGNAAVKAPIVGLRWAYPARVQYLNNAMNLLQEGYHQYKDQFFKINGNDMLVVPNKYVNELRAIPEEKLSSMVANIENVFRVAIQMRVIPPYFKRISSYLMPASWAVSRNLHSAQRLITPIVEERRRMETVNEPDYKPPNDFLQWLMDEAWNERDGQPAELVHRLLVLALASVHTTSMTATQVLYDIIAHPEYLEPLREEILQALKEDGGWQKTTLTKMRKLDSFMKESQRLNGPSLIGFKRAAMEDITLSDGTVLPKGVHMVVPVVPISLESVTPDPGVFQGFRFYYGRQKPGQSNLHQFAITDKNNMHFGHGKYSCPGRFFAAHAIKILIAHLILNYDFKFPEGTSRPGNLLAHEYCFPDPTAHILMKERDSPWSI